MEKSFRFSVHFVTGICIVCMLSACHVIRITESNTTSGRLVLKDKKGNQADSIVVKPNQLICWLIEETSGVSSLDSIFSKPRSGTVLRASPREKKQFKWKAQVLSRRDLERKGEVLKKGDYYVEDYNISWKDTTGTSHLFDPRIKVKSRVSGGDF